MDKTIPVAQASLIRRGAIDWRGNAAETGSAYDQWLGYLACHTGMSWGLSARAADENYRAHGGSSTQSASDRGSPGMFLLYERLMALPELTELRGEIEARCGTSHLTYGLFLCRRDACARLENGCATPSRKRRADLRERGRVRAGVPAGHLGAGRCGHCAACAGGEWSDARPASTPLAALTPLTASRSTAASRTRWPAWAVRSGK